MPLKGSFSALLLGAADLRTATTAYGMLISAFTSTQIAALFGTAILTVLPATQFSGMMTPVSSLAGTAQIMGRAFPMTYFVPISVGTFTKGLGFDDLGADLAALAVFVPVADADERAAAAQAGALRASDAQGRRTSSGLAPRKLRSFLHDYVLLGLVIYAFSLAVDRIQARSNSQELHNASIAIVDEDHSELSRRIAHAFLPPLFPAAAADRRARHRAADERRDDTPSWSIFRRISSATCSADANPALQINVDATAMVQAGLGSGYAQQIITTEIADFLSHAEGAPLSPVNLDVRIAFNPNVTTAWFTSVMGDHQQRHHAGDHSCRARRSSASASTGPWTICW